MSELPPELRVLVEGYRQILDQVDAGQIDVDTAYARLGVLSATDGAGARWSVSPDHEPDDVVFLRADAEGGPAAPTPPHLFAAGPAPTPTPDGRTSLFPEPDNSGWTDQVDDLLSPPATPNTPGGYGSDDSWGTDSFQPSWDGPNQGFPADVHVGAPTDTGWDTPYGAVPAGGADHADDHLDDEPAQSLYGHDVTPREGIVTRVFDLVGTVVDAVTSRFSSLAHGQRRTAIIAAACLIVVIVFVVTRGGDTEETSEPFTYNCPAPSLPISGATGDAAVLLGCLDSLESDPGPAIAGVAVERIESGEVMYRPDRVVTHAEAIHSAMRLYYFAGGPAPQSSTAVEVAGLPDDQAASVQAAADLGMVDATVSDLTGATTRGTQAQLLYRALTRAGVLRDAPGGTAPADAPAGTPEYGIAVASLRAAGIVDGAVADPFRFDDPMLVADWVLWAGRGAHEIRDPGSMARRLGAPAPGDIDAGRRPSPRGDGEEASPAEVTPGPERVTEVITAVISGDPALTAAAITDPGDAATVTERTALWVGFAELGLAVSPQAAPASADEGAVQVWQVGPADGDAVLTYQVTWSVQDGVWLLQGWPTR